MAGGKKGGENTKKAAGNAKKAEVAAAKAAQADASREQAESAEWNKGAKSNAKKEAAAEKAAEAARKKAEKDALLKEEEASLPSKPKGEGKKTAQKKFNAAPARGLDLNQLEGEDTGPKGALNASGIENALDALGLATSTGTNDKVDRHPERRFKAAYAAYEEKRLDEMADEKGLRRNQKVEMIRKEFEKSPDNPFNQALAGRYDMDKEELRDLREKRREETEKRLEGS